MPNAIPTLRLPRQHATTGVLRPPAKATHGSVRVLARQSYSVVACPGAALHRRQSSEFPPCVRHARTARLQSTSPSPSVIGAPAARRLVLVAAVRSGGENAGVCISPNALFQAHAAGPRSHGAQAARGIRRHAVPNPSFKRSANGRPPSPGRRYTVHFRQPGLGVLPSSPA